ncbi:MAG: hypothetical protein LUC43_08670 [Burkholderiales bacterium]|nr:hypothetical protein [Burkholderiales bacterium]
MKRTLLTAALLSTLVLTGCQPYGGGYRNSYGPSYVGQAQEVQQIDIVSVTPEAITVQNPNGGQTSKTIGTLIGAVAGAAIGGAVDRHRDPWGHRHPGGLGIAAGAVVGGTAGYAAGSWAGNRNSQSEGASITFRTTEGYTYTTLQAARACMFRPGPASMMNSGQGTVTIQPNNPGGC